jgi:hypothetical protein
MARRSPGSLLLAWGDWFGPAVLVVAGGLFAALFVASPASVK